MQKKISSSVINRLPRYYRHLSDLLENGVTRISSSELSQRIGTTASQIRQDLNCFGGFGQQGYGYNVSDLKDEIANILGLNRGYTAILIGAGHMGKTFVTNTKFESRGFKLIGVFDNSKNVIGTNVASFTVMDYANIGEFIKENTKQKDRMAIVTDLKIGYEDIMEELEFKRQ